METLLQEVEDYEEEFHELISDIPRLDEAITRLENRAGHDSSPRERNTKSKKRQADLERTTRARDDLKMLMGIVNNLVQYKPEFTKRVRQLQLPPGPLAEHKGEMHIIGTDLHEASRLAQAIEDVLLALRIEAPLLWYQTCTRVLDLTGRQRTIYRVYRREHGAGDPAVELTSPTQFAIKDVVTHRVDCDGVIGPTGLNKDIFTILRPHIRILLDRSFVHLFCYGTSPLAQKRTLVGKVYAGDAQGLICHLLDEAFYLVHSILNRYNKVSKLFISSFHINNKNEIRDCLTARLMTPEAQTPLQRHILDLPGGRASLGQALENRHSPGYFGVQLHLRHMIEPSKTVVLTIIDLPHNTVEPGQEASVENTDKELEDIRVVLRDLQCDDAAAGIGDNPLTRFLEPTLSRPRMKVIKLITVDEDAEPSAIQSALRFAQA
ncbi:MAG: hypothetical protein Q9196_002943 [Gyalolechia fulgens]